MPDRISAGPAWLTGWARLPLAILCGVVMGLGQAPYDLWFLAFPGLVGAIALLMHATSGVRAVGTGWAVGLGYFGFALGWIVEPFMVDVAVTGWMAPFALFGLAGGLALFWGLAFGVAVWVPGRTELAIVFVWALAELGRAYVLTGFPWALLGYLWAPVPPIQWVSIIGPHGLTLVSVALAVLCAVALLRPARRMMSLVGAGLGGAVLFAGGMAMIDPPSDSADQPVIRLVQPNAPQHEKWDRDMIPIFYQRQLNLTAAAPLDGGPGPDLIIWPETSVPSLLNRSGPLLREISDAAGPAELVLGIQREEEGRYYNSLIHLTKEGFVNAVYDKHHLVPFGEYMPAADLFLRWNIVGLASRAEAGYSPGPGPEILDLGPLGKALPLICYEAVFPHDVSRAPERAQMLLQITNDAWFGNWSGPYQHLAQARIRAIEQGLPMLRAANTGVSAVIDGHGRIVSALPLNESGFLDVALPHALPAPIYARIGDMPIMFILLAGFALMFVPARLYSIDRAGLRE